MANRARASSYISLALVLLSACGGPSPDRQPVEDSANLLTAEEESKLIAWHAALLEQYDIDFQIRTVNSAEDLAREAAESFEQAQVGSRSRTGRGLLLVIDSKDERVRLEVARQLEHVYVDSFVAYVEREQLAPFFAADRVGDGILAAAELIAGRAESGFARAEFDERPSAATSAGGGAEFDATIGGGAERPRASRATDTDAAMTPIGTVAAYLAAMAAHNAGAALDLYTPESRRMLADQVTTRAQMDNIVRTYGDCPEPEQVLDGAHAVLRYPPEYPACAPWLLQQDQQGRWHLDLIAMQRALRFDTRNHWRIGDPAALGPYGFAFDG